MENERELFTKTSHCTCELHCKTCRDQCSAGMEFRKSLMSQFKLPEDTVDFVCPKDKPWIPCDGKRTEEPAVKNSAIVQPAKCGTCTRAKRKKSR